MAKKWFASSELMGLPGLPVSTRGVYLKAKRENWKWRKRKARGGGKEYHFTSIPAEALFVLTNSEIINPRKTRSPGNPVNKTVMVEIVAKLRAEAEQQLRVCQAMVELLLSLEKTLNS